MLERTAEFTGCRRPRFRRKRRPRLAANGLDDRLSQTADLDEDEAVTASHWTTRCRRTLIWRKKRSRLSTTGLDVRMPQTLIWMEKRPRMPPTGLDDRMSLTVDLDEAEVATAYHWS